ncbi:MAG: hypothetical protein LEGION0398_MBIBDBAK_00231 [Legionellaceae bacterium]
MRYILLFLLSAFLLGCATESTLKAPCNAKGTNCGTKIKINQWLNEGNRL